MFMLFFVCISFASIGIPVGPIRAVRMSFGESELLRVDRLSQRITISVVGRSFKSIPWAHHWWSRPVVVFVRSIERCAALHVIRIWRRLVLVLWKGRIAWGVKYWWWGIKSLVRLSLLLSLALLARIAHNALWIKVSVFLWHNDWLNLLRWWFRDELYPHVPGSKWPWGQKFPCFYLE